MTILFNKRDTFDKGGSIMSNKKIMFKKFILFNLLMFLISFTFTMFMTNKIYAHQTSEDHIHYESEIQNDGELTFPFYILHGKDKTKGFHLSLKTYDNFDDDTIEVYVSTNHMDIFNSKINNSNFTLIKNASDLNAFYDNIQSKTYFNFTENYGVKDFAYSNLFMLMKTIPSQLNVNMLSTFIGMDLKSSLLVNPQSFVPSVMSFTFTFNPGLIPDTTQPVFDGWDGAYFTNVDNPISVEGLKSLLYAFDDVDGDVSDKIIIESDGYSSNKTTLGNYPVVFSVSDNSNNTSYLTIYVYVVDGSEPLINGPTTFNSYMSSPLSVDDIIDSFSVEDNYDTISNSKIEIVSNDFSGNEHEIDTYEIVFSVSDNSNNTGYKSVSVSVIDDIKPIISGENTYTKGQSAILTVDTITSSLNASDNYDGDISNLIVLLNDNYTQNNKTLGSYTIEYQVVDSSGNKSDIFIVTVNITDSIPPVFYVDTSIIHIDSTLNLTQEDIVQILIMTGQINTSKGYQVTFLEDHYNGTKEDGTYPLNIKIEYSDGMTKIVNLNVKVISQDYEEIIIKPWYKSLRGWFNQWFGLRFILNWVLKIFSITWVL